MFKIITYKSFSVFLLSLITACNLLPPSSPTDGNDGSIYEDNCYISDTTILPIWQQFSDSMKIVGFKNLKIFHVHEYGNRESRCSDYHHFNSEHFEINLNNFSTNSIQEDSLKKLQIHIVKRLFTNYLSNKTIMTNLFYVFRIGTKTDVLYRKEILDSCGFKIIPFGKNKWKRVP